MSRGVRPARAVLVVVGLALCLLAMLAGPAAAGPWGGGGPPAPPPPAQ
jgi:hypothetical protein